MNLRPPLGKMAWLGARTLFLSGVFVFLLQCDKGTEPSVPPSRCDLTLPAVKAEPGLASEYTRQRAACLDEAKAATAAGTFLGAFFNPGEDSLRSRMQREYASKGIPAGDITRLIEATIAGRGKVEGMAVAEISSTDPAYFGKGIPVFVIFNALILSSPLVQNEHDVESIFGHELQHAADWHGGISLGDLKLDQQARAGKAFSDGWLVALMELRAVYLELSRMYEDQVQKGALLASPAWFGSQAGNYSSYWRQVSELALTEIEVEAAGRQKENYAGISPEIKGDTLLVHFDLYGRKNTAVFTARPSQPKETVESGRGGVPLVGAYSFSRWRG